MDRQYPYQATQSHPHKTSPRKYPCRPALLWLHKVPLSIAQNLTELKGDGNFSILTNMVAESTFEKEVTLSTAQNWILSANNPVPAGLFVFMTASELAEATPFSCAPPSFPYVEVIVKQVALPSMKNRFGCIRSSCRS